MKFLLLIPAILLVFIAVILIRALSFKPKENAKVFEEEVHLDRELICERLCRLVRCKTVYYKDASLEDNAEFENLIAMLPELYPNVFEKCTFTQLEDRGLLFKWEGQKEGAPAVMMAHYDVVPARPELWDKPPFDAVTEDGVIWGRGTLDTKGTFNGVLSAADQLISEGFTPEYDMYFAFSGNEEINGRGAINIVD